MALLDQEWKDELVALILRELSKTRYACSSLTGLHGGSVNFIFRGILAQPLPGRDGNGDKTAKTVIVKQSTDFLSANANFPIEVSRCICEESMLNALQGFPSATAETTSIKTPCLYLFNRETNTQVLEDYPDTIDLKSLLVLPTSKSLLTRPVATSIGHDLGTWLRSFHTWASAEAQAQLRAEIGGNEPMRRLKHSVTYDSFIQILEKFPPVLEQNQSILEAVKEWAADEFKNPSTDEKGEYWGLIHGDFWAGNVLIPNLRSLEAQQPEAANKLVVIDWEYAQFGHRSHDLGQMIGDFYERKHFNDIDAAIWAIQGFVAGYGGLSDDMAFRTAIHTGVHLLHWYNRRAPTRPLTGTPDQIMGAVTLGKDFIVKGWEKDRHWFENSVLASLFAKN